MRLSGWANLNGGTIWAAIANAADELLGPMPIVVPHEVMATQQGTTAVLQGLE
jgi:hypothetical protein